MKIINQSKDVIRVEFNDSEVAQIAASLMQMSGSTCEFTIEKPKMTKKHLMENMKNRLSMFDGKIQCPQHIGLSGGDHEENCEENCNSCWTVAFEGIE